MTDGTEQLVELLGVHSVPPGSVVVVRGFGIDPFDEDERRMLRRIVGHDRWCVAYLPPDGDLTVEDIEGHMHRMHELLRERRA